ncbi:MAG: VOC family protein [Planctomycetes bacterium]|nr:VOC family protein [Planctomycetota bacterium]
MIKGLAHVCYTVSDLEASIRFYCGKLGLKPAFDFINDAGERYGVYIHVSGRTFIELFQAAKIEPAAGQSFLHICLEVDDIQATVAQLRESGIEVGDITFGGDNAWQAWLKDPDGNNIELHCYTPESKQTPWLA